MSHWAVIKQDDMYCDGEDVLWGPRWCVKSPTGVGWGNYATHAEALAYADRKARTREVVLPRDTAHPNEHLEIGPMYGGGAVVTTVDDGASLLLNLKEIRPLALALLAHAERMEE